MKGNMTMSQETTKNNLHSSKSILVIDTPESCEECPLRSYSNLELICTPMRKGASDVVCPLKPTPTKMRTDGDDIEEESYWEGWNDCIDAITGETE